MNPPSIQSRREYGRNWEVRFAFFEDGGRRGGGERGERVRGG